MSTISDTLMMPLADARLLNARRYGLTEENLSQFSEIMSSIKHQKLDSPNTGPDTGPGDVLRASTTDLIKDYIKHRITDRLSNAVGRDNTLGAFSQDMPTNPQDLILDMVGTPRKQSSDLSGLLNMHFDLNTLQMFS